VPLGEVNPVLGADNRVHLAYELLLANCDAGDLADGETAGGIHAEGEDRAVVST